MERYTHQEHFNSERTWFEIEKSPTGMWVKYSDVEALGISLSILISRIREVEHRDNWKTVEVDGMPKDGVYVGKFPDDGTGWYYLILNVKNQRWGNKILASNGPNYYREATPREIEG